MGQLPEGVKSAAFGFFLLFYYNQVLGLSGTLSGIALRYNHSVSDLMILNNLHSENRIRAGQSLRLYSALVPETILTASMDSASDDRERVLPPAEEASLETVAAVP